MTYSDWLDAQYARNGALVRAENAILIAMGVVAVAVPVGLALWLWLAA